MLLVMAVVRRPLFKENTPDFQGLTEKQKKS
jgi:hypothetical protein